MKKLLILFAVVCGCMMAQAQTIDAISATQGETTDWYPFGKSSRIDVTIYEQGNPVIEGKIYDLSKGNVETAFGTDPLPPIKEAAKNELEAKKTEVNHRMNQKAMGYEQIAEVQRAKEQGNEKVMLAGDAAKIYIDHATNESTIQKEKDNGLNAMEEETLNTLAGIQAAIAGYKEGMKNNINDIAMNAKNTINALGVYYTVKDQAINEIDKAVATAEASIDNATSEDDVKNAKNNALNEIDKQLAYVQDYYNKLQAAQQAANVDVDKAAADAEVAINQAATGYGNIETVQHVVVTYQTQLGSVKDKAKSSINEETNLDGVGQLKENTIKQIKDLQNRAEEEIQIAIQEFIALQQNAIKDVEQVAATAKEEIGELGVDEDAKKEGKEQIDIIVSTAKTTINEATNINKIYEANVQAISEIYNVVQNLKDKWSLTVSELGWTSLYYDKDLKIPNGVKVYYASGQSGDVVYLLEIKDNIPAETAVILKAEPGEYSFIFAEGNVAPLAGTNLFKGLLTDSLCSKVSSDEGGKTIYVLAGKDADGVLLFQPFNMTLNLKANKAYLPIDNGGTPSQSIKFRIADEEDVTDINSFRGTNADGKAVNLLGVPVSDSYKGIVLKGGKKILR